MYVVCMYSMYMYMYVMYNIYYTHAHSTELTRNLFMKVIKIMICVYIFIPVHMPHNKIYKYLHGNC